MKLKLKFCGDKITRIKKFKNIQGIYLHDVKAVNSISENKDGEIEISIDDDYENYKLTSNKVHYYGESVNNIWIKNILKKDLEQCQG